ncbi:MAG: T9SS type A sorting domain-containing protein [Bacteroidales bacterium]|nr:T9SS type A sorting domain-containing protein [Bacteroidales bacterium]
MGLKRIIWLIVVLPFSVFSQEATLYITGNLFTGKDNQMQATTLFVKGNILVEGERVSIDQNGVTTLTGDFINNVTSGNVFESDNTGLVEFNGTNIQYIGGSADKSSNYIRFPNVRIENDSSVRISPSMGVEVNDLYLDRGRLVLQSAVSDTSLRITEIAHLLVRSGGSVVYNREPEIITEKGLIEVELALGDNFENKRLIGFSSPYKRIYSDYFMFNFLSKPSPAGLFGDSNRLIVDISVPMNAGEGYIVGQGIIQDENYFQEHLNPLWSEADYNDRYTEKFSFIRDFMPHSFGQYNTEADRFTGEEINITDVETPLTQRGFNYVGNPYTTPLDLSSFVLETDVADEWGVTRSMDGTGELRNSFYVISGGTGVYNEQTDKYTFTVSYLLGQAVGGTLTNEELPSLQIAPMQMFIVGKNADGVSNFRIPATARSHGPAPFLKNTGSFVDELLIESRDEDTQAYDRLCVVFRPNATLLSNDPYDAVKLFNYSGGVSQIYTQSSNDRKMTTNVISPQTKSLNLYLQPSTDRERQVSLTAYRLNSLASVSGVWLEDKSTREKINLLETPTYTFTSSPTDDPDRFVLHFSETGVAIDYPEETSELTIFSFGNKVHVHGLEEQDLKALVSVSDIQGRILFQEKVGSFPEYTIEQYLAQGIYIVNIAGHRNVTKKVIVN